MHFATSDCILSSLLLLQLFGAQDVNFTTQRVSIFEERSLGSDSLMEYHCVVVPSHN